MKRLRSSHALAGALLTFLLLPATLLVAQQSMEFTSKRLGRVSGTVRDAQGAPVADVKISITTAANTKFRKEVTTAEDGTWAALLNDTSVAYHYRFEKTGYIAVARDKKVPLLNPGDEFGFGAVGKKSAELSVLDVQFSVAVPAPN